MWCEFISMYELISMYRFISMYLLLFPRMRGLNKLLLLLLLRVMHVTVVSEQPEEVQHAAKYRITPAMKRCTGT